ncbi:MAG TPA: hypothetical protein VFO01_18490 [Trebonia sp.]|nr:hypothetical protein [Trebonia sp.]
MSTTEEHDEAARGPVAPTSEEGRSSDARGGYGESSPREVQPVFAPGTTADFAIGRENWLVLAAVLPGIFMNVFDFFAVNVATPVLHAELGSGPPALELIVGGYGLTFSLGLATSAV